MGNGTAACTVIARNYVAHARVLARSYAAYHEDDRLHVLVVDGDSRELERADEPFVVHLPDELPLSKSEFRKMAGIYDVTELCTAVKPFYLRLFLDRGHNVVLFLDPDIEVFAPLSYVVAVPRNHAIVLTPHSLTSIPEDGLRPSAQDIAQAGKFNLGFIAVADRAVSFLDWWGQRLRRDCLMAVEEGLHVDQRFIDFLPAEYVPAVLRDPAFNVAYWNLHERNVSWNGTRYEINGSLLRAFHFSGFDPERPYMLSKHMGDRPRILLSERPDLARLCREYAEKLFANGYSNAKKLSYGFSQTAAGLPLDRRMRRLYREALLAAENGQGPMPADPLDSEGARAFSEWLNAPDLAAPKLTRYLGAVRAERVDLRNAFPDVTRDADRFLDWVRTDGRTHPPIPAALLPKETAAAPIAPAASATEGVNVVGYLRAELGVGEAARNYIMSLRAGNIPYAVVPFSTPWSRESYPFEDPGTGSAIYDISLVCVNADQFPAFAESPAAKAVHGRYTIGMWWWEVDVFPDWMAASARFVDEIWAGSKHAARAFAVAVDRPVITMPPPIVAPTSAPVSRAELGLPDGFIFLFSFDFHSVLERKNPIGLIEAYIGAFSPEDGAHLMIKSINGDKRIDDLERVRAAAAGRPDVHVSDGYLPIDVLNAWTASCDAYVSLHRSEGFGFTMAEAMALGKPVIATGYSGNLEFMTERNSYLVPYELVSVPPGCDPYPTSARWADPDLAVAGRLMRWVFEHREEASRRGARARREILAQHGPEARSRAIAARLAQVRDRQRAATAVVARSVAAIGNQSSVLSLDHPSSLSARSHAERLVESPVRLGSRLPGVQFAQRSVLRVLRPLTIHVREVAAALLDVLAEAESRLMAEIESVKGRVRALEGNAEAVRTELEPLADRIVAAEVRTERAEARTSELAGGFAEDHRNLIAIDERSKRTQERIDEVTRSLHALGDDHRKLTQQLRIAEAEERSKRTQERIDEVTRSLHALGDDHRKLTQQLRIAEAEASNAARRVEQLWQMLHPTPYMSDPRLLHRKDDAGREIIGYERGERALGGYAEFEEIFRGTEALVRDRQRVYLPLLQGHEPVVDVGCGRGELLDLLAESGVKATGVDLDKQMVERCLAKGHQVVQADALEYLRSGSDGSLGAIFSGQFVEHISYEDLLALLMLSERKLKAGGLFIAETPNPHSLAALKAFWVDLSHQKPIFPETLVALCRTSGFAEASVMYPNGEGDPELDRIWQGEYAVIARKA